MVPVLTVTLTHPSPLTLTPSPHTLIQDNYRKRMKSCELISSSPLSIFVSTSKQNLTKNGLGYLIISLKEKAPSTLIKNHRSALAFIPYRFSARNQNRNQIHFFFILWRLNNEVIGHWKTLRQHSETIQSSGWTRGKRQIIYKSKKRKIFSVIKRWSRYKVGLKTGAAGLGQAHVKAALLERYCAE